jgi:hypothetical protein
MPKSNIVLIINKLSSTDNVDIIKLDAFTQIETRNFTIV